MRELLCEVLSICHKISTGSVADVFFQYAPHCNTYDVFVYRDGFDADVEADWLDLATEIAEDNLGLTIFKLRNLAKKIGVEL